MPLQGKISCKVWLQQGAGIANGHVCSSGAQHLAQAEAATIPRAVLQEAHGTLGVPQRWVRCNLLLEQCSRVLARRYGDAARVLQPQASGAWTKPMSSSNLRNQKW